MEPNFKINATPTYHLQNRNVHPKDHITFAIYTPVMMAQDRAEITRENNQSWEFH